MRLEGKVALITGAGAGIGRESSLLFATEGASVAAVDVNEESATAVAADIREAGGEAVAIVADVSTDAGARRMIDETVDRYGRLDVLFNNAGIMPTGNLSELRRDEWRRMLDTNIMGVLNGIAAVLPAMRRQKSGHILATDSVAGHVVYPGSAVYCGTKFAVRAIMEGLRQEERENNIRSTLISPGLVNTELYKTIADKELGESLRKASEIPGVGLTSDDVAEAVAYVLGTHDGVAVSEIVLRPTNQVV